MWFIIYTVILTFCDMILHFSCNLVINVYNVRMARRKTNTRSKSKQIHLNKYNIWIPFILIGFLYYFCYFFAKDTPIFQRFESVGSFIFGISGLLVISAFALIFGILCIYKEAYIWRFFKQFAILSILVSMFMNITIVSSNDIDKYIQYGGYVSWLPLQLFKMIFGDNLFAMQTICIMAIVGILVRIWYTVNLDIPSINFVYKTHDDNTSDSKTIKNEKTDKNNWYDKKSWFSSIFDQNKWSDIIENGNNDNSFQNKKISNNNINNTKNNAQFGAGYDSKDDLKEKIKNDLLSRVSVLKNGDKSENTFSIKNNNLWDKNTELPVVKKNIYFDTSKPAYETKPLVHGDNKWSDLVDDIYIQSRATIIENKFAEFGINVKTVWYSIWPAIIQLQIQPQAWVKLSKIESLKDDLLLALKTKTIRIIAPISGTDLVGIEIVNPSPTMVHMADMLESDSFASKQSDNLTNLPIWKAIDGSILIKSLESMPHLLVAGATGMGKSVTVNNFILSLIYQNTPEELKFIMIDPKQVEMELYSGIPYLLCPIVTDSDKALKALKRCVDEMEMRYTILKNHRVKNVYEYNEIASKEEKMWRIVVVIDELADLMLSSKLRKDVEIAITRIAQKARAVGMHLLIATQRPQVNVITGIIKANIPARIALWVISWIDSRTILDTKWAEDLVSKWDLLYIDPSSRQPIRVQSPFVSTSDTEKIIKMIKDKYLKWVSDEANIYDQWLVALLESNKWSSGWWIFANAWWGDMWDSDDEILVSQAIELISWMRTASTTMLQRKLQIWFARAGRIMDELERRGIVWPQEPWWKPRQVLM